MRTEYHGFSRSLLQVALLSAGLIGMVGMAYAQEEEAEELSGVIRTPSGFDMVPTLQVGLKHDDNVVRSNTNEISSWVLNVAPLLKSTLKAGADTYTFSAAVNKARYASSRADDFMDSYFEGEAKISPSSQHNFKLKGNRSWLHEDRGTGVSEGRGFLQEGVTTFQSDLLDGEYQYGSDSSRGRVRLNNRYYVRKYTNFRDITQYRDFTSTRFGGAFLYQTQSSFSLVAEASTAEIDFFVMDLSGDRNNTDQNLRLGLEWEFSSVTNGSLLLGYQDKNFEWEAREDFQGFAWEAILVWQPLTYSGIDIATGRRAKDIDAVNVSGDFIVETTYALGWNHQWHQDLDTKIAYEHQTNEYNLSDRKDVSTMLTLELNKRMARWMNVKFFANIEDRKSSQGVIEFDRSVVGLTFEMTL